MAERAPEEPTGAVGDTGGGVGPVFVNRARAFCPAVTARVCWSVKPVSVRTRTVCVPVSTSTGSDSGAVPTFSPSICISALVGALTSMRPIFFRASARPFSASVRCGYIAARPDWIEGLVDLQVATAFGGPSPVATELIASVLAGGGYRRHLEELRRRLVGARRETADRLAPLGIRPWIAPRGGFFLWCRLPDGLDSADVARRALDDAVVLAPGDVFSVSRSASAYLRFNVAQSRDPRVFSALRHVMTA